MDAPWGLWQAAIYECCRILKQPLWETYHVMCGILGWAGWILREIEPLTLELLSYHANSAICHGLDAAQPFKPNFGVHHMHPWEAV